VLRDVLDFPPEVIAAVLDSSVTATASALQRARATIRPALPPAGSQLPDPAAVPSFARAYEQADPTELLLCLTEDATLTIEPPGTVVHGREPVAKALLTDIGVPGPRRLLPTVANGRPSVAVYTGLPDAPALRPSAIVVLTATAGEVATLDAFTDPGLFRTFGLPPVLPARSRTAQPW
jgi:RNA polymerase sigma-70 factor (ECF subfamily)